MTPLHPGAHAGVAFVTTRWTHVLSARGASAEARIALGELCEAYWMPVFRFIGRACPSEDSARDLTQAFFAHILTHHGLDGVDPAKGRFRSYLLGAVKHFLSTQWDHNHAVKRGGGQETVPLPQVPPGDTTAVLQIPDPATPAPDSFFDRHWALNVIDRALSALATEFSDTGKSETFEILKPWLVGDIGSVSQLETARRLGSSEGATKTAIHRLRKRFRDLVKDEIAATIDPRESVQQELQYLLEALARC